MATQREEWELKKRLNLLSKRRRKQKLRKRLCFTRFLLVSQLSRKSMRRETKSIKRLFSVLCSRLVCVKKENVVRTVTAWPSLKPKQPTLIFTLTPALKLINARTPSSRANISSKLLKKSSMVLIGYALTRVKIVLIVICFHLGLSSLVTKRKERKGKVMMKKWLKRRKLRKSALN